MVSTLKMQHEIYTKLIQYLYLHLQKREKLLRNLDPEASG